MSILFVDETYGDDHYYTVGVLISERDYKDLETRLLNLAYMNQVRWAMPKTPEFHAHELMNNGTESDWQLLGRNVATRIGIYQVFLNIVAESGCRIFIEGVVPSALKSRYKYPRKPHEITLMHLLERVNEYCNRSGETFSVCADVVPGQDCFLEIAKYHIVNATPGYRSQKFVTLDLIDFVDSKESIGVQVADMVAYIYRRVKHETSASRNAKRAATRLYRTIENLVLVERLWKP